MDSELEVKFYPVNKEEYREKLLSLGAKLMIPERLMKRVIFSHQVNPQISCHYLRVRDEGGVIRLSAKLHADQGGQVSDQKEAEVEVNDFDQTIEILKQAGLKQNRYQETLREEWEYKGVEITIDTWPCLDTYTEIEGQSEDEVRMAAKELGFNWEKKVILAAPEIAAKVYDLSLDEVLEKFNYLTFEKNPFAGLPRKSL